MGGLGAPELLIVLAVVLVLFGGAKLPQLARSLGQAQREFRSAHDDTRDELPEAKPGSTKPGGSSSQPPA